jgi:isoquinoline 1-oxidoreductase beta subunit
MGTGGRGSPNPADRVPDGDRRHPDGTVSFAMPRAEVGQGITTAVAMTIAEEMDVLVSRVRVTLADARPELTWNQISCGTHPRIRAALKSAAARM